jgi:hypothetical protein
MAMERFKRHRICQRYLNPETEREFVAFSHRSALERAAVIACCSVISVARALRFAQEDASTSTVPHALCWSVIATAMITLCLTINPVYGAMPTWFHRYRDPLIEYSLVLLAAASSALRLVAVPLVSQHADPNNGAVFTTSRFADDYCYYIMIQIFSPVRACVLPIGLLILAGAYTYSVIAHHSGSAVDWCGAALCPTEVIIAVCMVRWFELNRRTLYETRLMRCRSAVHHEALANVLAEAARQLEPERTQPTLGSRQAHKLAAVIAIRVAECDVSAPNSDEEDTRIVELKSKLVSAVQIVSSVYGGCPLTTFASVGDLLCIAVCHEPVPPGEFEDLHPAVAAVCIADAVKHAFVAMEGETAGYLLRIVIDYGTVQILDTAGRFTRVNGTVVTGQPVHEAVYLSESARCASLNATQRVVDAVAAASESPSSARRTAQSDPRRGSSLRSGTHPSYFPRGSSSPLYELEVSRMNNFAASRVVGTVVREAMQTVEGLAAPVCPGLPDRIGVPPSKRSRAQGSTAAEVQPLAPAFCEPRDDDAGGRVDNAVALTPIRNGHLSAPDHLRDAALHDPPSAIAVDTIPTAYFHPLYGWQFPTGAWEAEYRKRENNEGAFKWFPAGVVVCVSVAVFSVQATSATEQTSPFFWMWLCVGVLLNIATLFVRRSRYVNQRRQVFLCLIGGQGPMLFAALSLMELRDVTNPMIAYQASYFAIAMAVNGLWVPAVLPVVFANLSMNGLFVLTREAQREKHLHNFTTLDYALYTFAFVFGILMTQVYRKRSRDLFASAYSSELLYQLWEAKKANRIRQLEQVMPVYAATRVVEAGLRSLRGHCYLVRPRDGSNDGKAEHPDRIEAIAVLADANVHLTHTVGLVVQICLTGERPDHDGAEFSMTASQLAAREMSAFVAACITLEASIADVGLLETVFISTIGSTVHVMVFDDALPETDARVRLQIVADSLASANHVGYQLLAMAVSFSSVAGALVGLPRQGRHFEVFGKRTAPSRFCVNLSLPSFQAVDERGSSPCPDNDTTYSFVTGEKRIDLRPASLDLAY